MQYDPFSIANLRFRLSRCSQGGPDKLERTFGIRGNHRGYYGPRDALTSRSRDRPMGLDDPPLTRRETVDFRAIPTHLRISALGGVIER